jgi:hypothetical protein
MRGYPAEDGAGGAARTSSRRPVLAQLFGGGEAATAPVDLDRNAAEVEHAWTLAHDSRFAALNERLTGLLTRL